MNPNRSCNSGVHHVASAPAWPSGSCSFRGSDSPGEPGTPGPDRTTDPRLRAAARPSRAGASVNSPRLGGWPRAGERAELGTVRGRTTRGTRAPPPSLGPQALFSLASSERTGSGSHAVGIGDRAGFRSRGGVSRRAQNLLRTQKSTSEEQVSGDSWREARRAAGAPRAPHPGARKAGRPGSGTRTPCPCPGAEGELPPAVGGRARWAGAPPGEGASVQVRSRGAAKQPRTAGLGEGSLGSTCWPLRLGGGWGAPGAQVAEEERGTRTLSQWEGGKKSF